MDLRQAIDRKSQARVDLAAAPFETKLAALIRMQTMAREMARAAGRPFKGVVWKPPPADGPPATGTA
jgi:hypothetical protein